MSRPAVYRQCRLRKTHERGYSEQVGYVPEPFCTLDRVLKLRDDDGRWDDGWQVVEVSGVPHTEEAVNAQGEAHRRFAKKTRGHK